MNRKTESPLRAQIVRGVQKMILDSNMTYKELAHRLGVHPNVVASYMFANPRVPSVETLALLCRELNVSADVVLGLEEGQNVS